MSIPDYLRELGETSPANQYTRLGKGQHEFTLYSLSEFQTQSNGKAIRAELMIEKSSEHIPGEIVDVAFFVQSRQKYPGEHPELKKLQAFGQALFGTDDSQKCAAMIGKALRPEQPARGIRGKAIGTETKPNDAGTTYVNHKWVSAPGQTKESIAAKRREIESGASAPVAAPEEPDDLPDDLF